MAHQALRVLALAVACLPLAGCPKWFPGSGAPDAGGELRPVVATVWPEQASEPLSSPAWKPGSRMEAGAEAASMRDTCAGRPLPFVRLDANEVFPPTLRPGGRLRHRLVYSFCPDIAGASVSGSLRTRILLGSKLLHQDTVESFVLNPGRWVVDSELLVPKQAPAGTYYLHEEYRGPGPAFTSGVGFYVKK